MSNAELPPLDKHEVQSAIPAAVAVIVLVALQWCGGWFLYRVFQGGRTLEENRGSGRSLNVEKLRKRFLYELAATCLVGIPLLAAPAVGYVEAQYAREGRFRRLGVFKSVFVIVAFAVCILSDILCTLAAMDLIHHLPGDNPLNPPKRNVFNRLFSWRHHFGKILTALAVRMHSEHVMRMTSVLRQTAWARMQVHAPEVTDILADEDGFKALCRSWPLGGASQILTAGSESSQRIWNPSLGERREAWALALIFSACKGAGSFYWNGMPPAANWWWIEVAKVTCSFAVEGLFFFILARAVLPLVRLLAVMKNCQSAFLLNTLGESTGLEPLQLAEMQLRESQGVMVAQSSQNDASLNEHLVAADGPSDDAAWEAPYVMIQSSTSERFPRHKRLLDIGKPEDVRKWWIGWECIQVWGLGIRLAVEGFLVSLIGIVAMRLLVLLFTWLLFCPQPGRMVFSGMDTLLLCPLLAFVANKCVGHNCRIIGASKRLDEVILERCMQQGQMPYILEVLRCRVASEENHIQVLGISMTPSLRNEILLFLVSAAMAPTLNLVSSKGSCTSATLLAAAGRLGANVSSSEPLRG